MASVLPPFAAGKVSQAFMFLLIMALFSIFILQYYLRGKKSKPNLRNIAAIDAVDEVAGRAAEMNKPVHYTASASFGSISATSGAALVSGFSFLNVVARACAKVKVKVIVTSASIESAGLVQELLSNAYRAEGAFDIFDPVEQIVMKSPYIYAWCAMTLGVIMGKQCAGNIIMSTASAANVMLLEAGLRQGSIQITANPGSGESTAMCVAMVDHQILGPECYGVGAFVTGEPEQLWTLLGQDAIAIAIYAAVFIGMIVANLEPGLSSGGILTTTWWYKLFTF